MRRHTADMSYTEQELEKLLREGEADLVERKPSPADTGDLRKDICAFANDLPSHQKPGVIFVGVHDDGRCANLKVTDQMLQNLAHLRSDGQITPFPSMVVQRRVVKKLALIASDFVVIPLAPDLFSLQGLRNLGPTLRKWRAEWRRRLTESPDVGIPLPRGQMQPVGYIVQQHAVRLDRPVKAYGRWMNRIPCEYQESVRDEPPVPGIGLENDPNCITTLKNYRSLMPLAQVARKPMFALKAADGALGGHATAALDVYRDYKKLAQEIARRCGIRLEGPAQPSLFSAAAPVW